MDEAHFRPPLPLKTAKVLGGLAIASVAAGIVAWSTLGWIASVVAAVVALVCVVFATLLRRVELIVGVSGIEVVDITGRRRQAWVGTKRLSIDFSRPRPVLEIDAPGPGQAYRSTLVLAGLEAAEHAEAREHLEALVRRWAGPNVTFEFVPPGGPRPDEG